MSIFFQVHILEPVLSQDFVGGTNPNQQTLKIYFGSGMAHLIIYINLKYILILKYRYLLCKCDK